MTDVPRITGVLSPVVTPFGADLAPDPERFVPQCRWLLSQNFGLAIFGTNSEANSLSVEEKRFSQLKRGRSSKNARPNIAVAERTAWCQ